jgi:hypothetical protein
MPPYSDQICLPLYNSFQIATHQLNGVLWRSSQVSPFLQLAAREDMGFGDPQTPACLRPASFASFQFRTLFHCSSASHGRASSQDRRVLPQRHCTHPARAEGSDTVRNDNGLLICEGVDSVSCCPTLAGDSVTPMFAFVIGFIVLALRLRRLTRHPSQLEIATLCLVVSGTLYTLGYLLIGVSTDPRYHYWSMVAIFLAGVMCVSEELQRFGSSSRKVWAYIVVVPAITLAAIVVAHAICGDALSQLS